MKTNWCSRNSRPNEKLGWLSCVVFFLPIVGQVKISNVKFAEDDSLNCFLNAAGVSFSLSFSASAHEKFLKDA